MYFRVLLAKEKVAGSNPLPRPMQGLRAAWTLKSGNLLRLPFVFLPCERPGQNECTKDLISYWSVVSIHSKADPSMS
jgi:hypothetical protein